MTNQQALRRVIRWIVIPGLFGLSLIISWGSINGLFWSVMIILLANILIGFDNIKERGAFVLFNITFFTFLLGMLLFQALSGKQLFDNYKDSTKERVFLGVGLSLMFITVGMLYGEKRRRKKTKFREVRISQTEEQYLERYRNTLKVIVLLFYITYPFNLLYVIDRASYVSSTSYLSFYISYSTSIPYLLIKIGELNQIIFCMFYCLEYRRNKLIAPTILFFIQSVLSLGIGQRNIFVLDLLMFIVLIGYANKKSKRLRNTPIYTKHMVIIVAVAVPILIVFLEYWGNVRMGQAGNVGGIRDSIEKFFTTQGSQIDFFADTIERKKEIWKQTIPYTFASPYNYFRNLFGLKDFGTYTVENAMYGNSLAATQFYITSPGSLISGKGAGCCYLSELYYDFGLFGIVIGSAFLGYILGKLALSESNKYWVNAFIALMIRNIIYIPRASFFEWLSAPFNIWNVFLVVCILVFVDKGRLKIR